MKIFKYFFSITAGCLLCLNVAQAIEFNDAQTQAIESIVHHYLVSHPEVLLETSEALQEQQQTAMQQEAQTIIEDNLADLFEGNSPILGNAQGDTTIVMFTDYQCIYCKNMADILTEVLAEDDDLRLIVKELPINGANSEYAAKAALAAHLQGKYTDFHHTLLTSETALTQPVIMQLARNNNIDVQQLREDIESDAVLEEIDNNLELAYKFRLLGTPIFVIAGHLNDDNEAIFLFIPGAIEKDALQKFIAQVRK